MNLSDNYRHPRALLVGKSVCFVAVLITKEEVLVLDFLLSNSGTVGIWTCETMSLLLIFGVVTSELILKMHLKDLISVQRL